MIKQNQQFLNAILVLTDVVIILFALLTAFYIRFKTTIFGPIGGYLGFGSYFIFTLFAVIPVYLLFFYFFGLYKPFRNQKSIFSEATSIIKANLMS